MRGQRLGTDQPKLVESRIHAGHWEGRLISSGATMPQVELWHGSQRLCLAEATAAAESGEWKLSAQLSADVMNDGVQTVLLRLAGTDDALGHFAIIVGDALEEDLRAEVDLLRAELDMLKRAFRRHCVEHDR